MAANQTPAAFNQALVALLRERGELRDPAVEAAFLAVPRHLFVPGVPLERAYADDAVPVKRDSDGSVLSSLSQPSMIASMLRQLRLRPGDNVLEIGAGTGYTAALMRTIVGDSGKVTSVEIDPEMARQAQRHLQQVGMSSKVAIVQGDGALGYGPRASYDRIIATVGIWDVPEAWIQQLKPGGILVAPIWMNPLQASAAFSIQPDGSLYSANNQLCGFIRLRGSAAGPAVSHRFGSSSLVLLYGDDVRLDQAALSALLSEDREECYADVVLSAENYWNGFLPYLMLNIPAGCVLALYSLMDDVSAYGVDQAGFAVIGPGSASFVPYGGQGKIYCFAGADTFLAVDESLHAWDAAGRPDSSRLRLQLRPVERGAPSITGGRVYPRRDHSLHVWFDTGGAS